MSDKNVTPAKLLRLIQDDIKDAGWQAAILDHVRVETGINHNTLKNFTESDLPDATKIALLKHCLTAYYGKKMGALRKPGAPVVETGPVRPHEVETEDDEPSDPPVVEHGPEVPDEVAPEAPAPVRKPAIPGGKSGSLEDALRNFIAEQTVKTSIDETTVRNVVAKAMQDFEKKLVIPPRDVVEIRKWDGTVVEIPGRKHPVFGKVLKLAHRRMNILLVGPAGCGKTTLASQVAEAMKLRFGHVSLSQGITEGKLIGRETATGYVEAKAIEFYKDGGLWLWDELDAGDNNVLINWNAAWSNHVVVNGRGESFERHKDNVQMAAANTFGLGADRVYVGRNQLDAATLDRWYVVEMGYDEDLETELAGDSSDGKELVKWVHSTRKKAAEKQLRVVVSTRWITKGVAALQAGLDLTEVKQDLTAHLKTDERKALFA